MEGRESIRRATKSEAIREFISQLFTNELRKDKVYRPNEERTVVDDLFIKFLMGAPENIRFFPNHTYLSNAGKRYYARHTQMQYFISWNILICQEILNDKPFHANSDVVVSNVKKTFHMVNGALYKRNQGSLDWIYDNSELEYLIEGSQKINIRYTESVMS